MALDPSSRSPTLRKLLKSRLAPVREKELISKALSPERPVRPPTGDCCGSSCKPCIMDLYREELKVWKECWEVEGGGKMNDSERPNTRKRSCGKDEMTIDGDATIKDPMEGKRMPGSFDW